MVMRCRRVWLVAGLLSLAAQNVWAQTPDFQGAWLEDGQACADVFVSKGTAVGFKRPANVFVAAFIVRGKQLSTPLASCRIGRTSTSGQRHVLQLTCTTTIATETTRAVLALDQDGGLSRYNAIEGGASAKYRRCTPDSLKTP